MSRIGKKKIAAVKGVEVKQNLNTVKVKGPKGELVRELPAGFQIAQQEGAFVVSPVKENKSPKLSSLWGLTRTMLSNMIVGVSQGFTKVLEFNGVGYRAQVAGSKLTLNLGYSHPIDFDLPKFVEAKVVKNQIFVTGIDKEVLGMVTAKIRSFRPPEPYKGKGVKYENEVILRKAGKTGAKK